MEVTDFIDEMTRHGLVVVFKENASQFVGGVEVEHEELFDVYKKKFVIAKLQQGWKITMPGFGNQIEVHDIKKLEDAISLIVDTFESRGWLNKKV